MINEVQATLISGSLAFIGIAVGAFLAYCFAIKQMQAQNRLQIQLDLIKRRTNALETTWQLLCYTAESENEWTLLRWRKLKGQDKQYYIDLYNLKSFLEVKVPQLMYENHAALYLPSHIKTCLFEYTGSLYGLYFSYCEGKAVVSSGEGRLQIVQNPQLIEKLTKLANELRELLRQELGYNYEESLHTIVKKLAAKQEK